RPGTGEAVRPDHTGHDQWPPGLGWLSRGRDGTVARRDGQAGPTPRFLMWRRDRRNPRGQGTSDSILSQRWSSCAGTPQYRQGRGIPYERQDPPGVHQRDPPSLPETQAMVRGMQQLRLLQPAHERSWLRLRDSRGLWAIRGCTGWKHLSLANRDREAAELLRVADAA